MRERETLTRVVVSLGLTRLDYCDAVLAGLPSCQLNRLQSVINAAARLVLSGCHSDHITPLPMDLHGCTYLRGSSSNRVRWRTVALMVQHLRVSLTASSGYLILRPENNLARQ